MLDRRPRGADDRGAARSGEVYRARSVTGYDEAFRPEALPGFEFTLSVVALPEGP